MNAMEPRLFLEIKSISSKLNRIYFIRHDNWNYYLLVIIDGLIIDSNTII